LATKLLEDLRGQLPFSSNRFMPRKAITLAATGLLLLVSYAGAHRDENAAASATQSLYTSLNANSCTKATDEDDPNDTPYLVCPGVAGYLLQIRQVESGRLSINVVNPAKQQFPLNYQDVVTRSMSSLDEKAEWRVRREKGKLKPLALIVRVMARENQSEPEKITSTFLAVAKIAAGGACVTDRIRQGSRPAAEMRALADSAASRSCASQLPVTAGAHIR
jgi:hypothetical protein